MINLPLLVPPLAKKVHVHSRTRVSLATKYRICAEAFGSCSIGIRPTARKYQIQPSQIRRWKKLISTITEHDEDAFASTKNSVVVVPVVNFCLRRYLLKT